MLIYITSIASFAAFVIVSTTKGERVDTIVGAAVWDILRDYVVLVLQGHFLRTLEETLSFVVCASACEALLSLLQHVPGIGELSFNMKSPL